MSAINVFLQPRRALLMTDASLYTPGGDVIAFGPKAAVLPTLSCAVACRGPQQTTHLIASEIPYLVGSFDAFWQRSDELLCGWYDRNAVALERMGHSNVQIVVAGWSTRKDRAAGFYFDSAASLNSTFEIDEYVSGPETDDTEDANLHSIDCELYVDVFPHSFDPVRHGIPYMEAQRRMPIDIGGQKKHIVGGHIMVSEVTRDCVSQRIIHRWPDQPGEPIRPEPFRPAGSSTIPLNRQQRRAMERQHRRH